MGKQEKKSVCVRERECWDGFVLVISTLVGILCQKHMQDYLSPSLSSLALPFPSRYYAVIIIIWPSSLEGIKQNGIDLQSTVHHTVVGGKNNSANFRVYCDPT